MVVTSEAWVWGSGNCIVLEGAACQSHWTQSKEIHCIFTNCQQGPGKLFFPHSSITYTVLPILLCIGVRTSHRMSRCITTVLVFGSGTNLLAGDLEPTELNLYLVPFKLPGKQGCHCAIMATRHHEYTKQYTKYTKVTPDAFLGEGELLHYSGLGPKPSPGIEEGTVSSPEPMSILILKENHETDFLNTVFPCL